MLMLSEPRRSPLRLLVLALISCLLAGAIPMRAAAEPFTWARSSDALTLDPHAVNEGITHAFNHHIYEPLIIRGPTGQLLPALATAWRQSLNAKVWLFDLRQGVTFHDGRRLSAQDVIFSLKRALSPTSDLRTRLQGVKSYVVNERGQIQITTHAADPLLPIRLTDIFIMSQSWAEENNAGSPQAFMTGETTFASGHTNGTGPYRLVSREPGKETRLARYDDYWGWKNDPKLEKRIREIRYLPIPDDKERINALLEGSIDFVQDVPLAELEVIRQAPDLTVSTGPENRVIFLGLSVKSTTPDGKANPLANVNARKALTHALDRFAIQRTIMLGQAIPTGVVAPPGINGFPTDLDVVPARDLTKARALLRDAGVGEGTALTLDCPNNRYVNDHAICRAVAKQLSEAGLNVTPALRPKGAHFKKVRSGQSQFYLLGWGVPTFDSAYVFTNLFHTRTDTIGTWNGTGYSNPDLDQLITELATLSGTGARNRSMEEIWLTVRDAQIYIPLHVQTLAYAMHKGVNVDVDISNAPKLKNAIIEAAGSDG